MRAFSIIIIFIFGINCVFTENNESKPIVPKCCKINEYVKTVQKTQKKFCVKTDRALNLSDVVVYDKYYRKTNYSIHDFFNVMPGKFKSKPKFRKNAFDLMEETTASESATVLIYLTEAGLIFESPNTYNRYTPITSDSYCADYTINKRNITEQRFWIHIDTDGVKENNEYLFTSAMVVSAVFLFIVLVVYATLKELRNLCGMILMAYVASLFSTNVLIAILRLLPNSDNINSDFCINFSCAIYFSSLSAFCWINVMSYDIWWTFRGYPKARPINRRGKHFKFLMYCIYAFGVPLAMTIFFKVVNSLDLHHMPWFIKPMIPQSGCFLVDGQKFVYLYIPILIMIFFNWVFFLMTAFNIWRLSRGTAVLDSAAAGTPAAHRSHMQRFLVYVKLSIVMGLNWLLEVVRFLLPSLEWFWWISDTYNVLIGVFIFTIFVCKPKILKKLSKLMKEQKIRKWIPDNSMKSTSSSEDSSSQETQSMQICTHPNLPTSF